MAYVIINNIENYYNQTSRQYLSTYKLGVASDKMSFITHVCVQRALKLDIILSRNHHLQDSFTFPLL